MRSISLWKHPLHCLHAQKTLGYLQIMINPHMAGSAERCRASVWLLIVWYPRIGFHTDQLRINGSNSQRALAWKSKEINWEKLWRWQWPWGSQEVSAQYLSEGCHPGAPLIMIFLFPPLRETAEAMAYSLSLSLLYLGLLCGNRLVSARGSELFTAGNALATMSKTFVILLCQSWPICNQVKKIY